MTNIQDTLVRDEEVSFDRYTFISRKKEIINSNNVKKRKGEREKVKIKKQEYS